MHDPMVVAFEIPRPWPKVSKSRRPERLRIKYRNRPWWKPGSYDAFDKCPRTSHWQWHVHHWHIQVQPLQAFRRWLLTRCEWCGGRSRRHDVVNFSHGWDREPGPWWRGERGLYHHDCSTVSIAHRTCTCPDPLLNHDGYGSCALCGRFRSWGAKPEMLAKAAQVRAEIPEGTRNTAATNAIYQS